MWLKELSPLQSLFWNSQPISRSISITPIFLTNHKSQEYDFYALEKRGTLLVNYALDFLYFNIHQNQWLENNVRPKL